MAYLTINFHKTMEEKRGKGTKARKSKPSFSPWCRCAAAREPTPKSHSSPAVLFHPSPVSLVTTEPPRRNHTLQRETKIAAALELPLLYITCELLKVAQC